MFKKLTDGYTKVPLLWIDFNLKKYRKDGAKNSCDIKLHPDLRDDILKEKINDIVDYIRDNYDMERLVK